MPKKMKLIADSGSTKTTWALISEEGQKVLKTQGMSPYFLNEEEMKHLLQKELLPHLGVSEEKVMALHFYGTGVSVKEKADQVERALRSVFSASVVEVNHDLTGAARALCQDKEGIACILGTGSGACYYDGSTIQKISPGLGFILGDEGSGAYLGKMIIRHYLYQKFNPTLRKAFEDKYHLSKAEILRKVYQGEFPNRFLASFTHFLTENRGKGEIEVLLETGMDEFITAHVEEYEEANRLPIGFVGGVADAFSDIVQRLCLQHRLECGVIMGKPIEGLIKFHQ